jgi:hypothetical protein
MVRRGARRARTGWRVAVALAAGAAILASCGTPTPAVAPFHLSGTPALSFAVPLTDVSCTLNDVCVAIGSSSSDEGPTSVAEFATPHGNWLNLALPSTSSILLTTVACSGSQCLIGGSSPGHDVLWLFNSHGSSLTPLTPPSQGIGVSSLTCSVVTCALIDAGPGGVPRFSLSSNDGTTWSTPSPLHFAKSDAVTTFSCGSASDCALGLMTLAHVFSLYVTNDGGTSWSTEATPSTWTTLTSLTCQLRRCVALATTKSATQLVRSTTFATTWKVATLAHSASSVACTTSTRCVVVGQRANGQAWLSLMHDKSTTNVALRYVPSPLIGVACGSKVCAAIGVTTLLSVPFTT